MERRSPCRPELGRVENERGAFQRDSENGGLRRRKEAPTTEPEDSATPEGKPPQSRQSAQLPQGAGTQGFNHRTETFRGKCLAHRVGLEPTTLRLTAALSYRGRGVAGSTQRLSCSKCSDYKRWTLDVGIAGISSGLVWPASGRTRRLVE